MFDVVNLKIDAPGRKGETVERRAGRPALGAWYSLVKKRILISYKYLQHSRFVERIYLRNINIPNDLRPSMHLASYFFPFFGENQQREGDNDSNFAGRLLLASFGELFRSDVIKRMLCKRTKRLKSVVRDDCVADADLDRWICYGEGAHCWHKHKTFDDKLWLLVGCRKLNFQRQLFDGLAFFLKNHVTSARNNGNVPSYKKQSLISSITARWRYGQYRIMWSQTMSSSASSQHRSSVWTEKRKSIKKIFVKKQTHHKGFVLYAGPRWVFEKKFLTKAKKKPGWWLLALLLRERCPIPFDGTKRLESHRGHGLHTQVAIASKSATTRLSTGLRYSISRQELLSRCPYESKTLLIDKVQTTSTRRTDGRRRRENNHVLRWWMNREMDMEWYTQSLASIFCTTARRIFLSHGTVS